MILFFGDVGGGMIPSWLELSVLLLVYFFNDFFNKSYREVVLGYDGCMCMYVCMYLCIYDEEGFFVYIYIECICVMYVKTL